MLRLSINMLSNLFNLFQEIYFSGKQLFRDEIIYYQAYSVNFDAMLETAEKCGWIFYSENKTSLTPSGKKIIASKVSGLTKEALRLMLSDYIIKAQPIWKNRIPYGRKEAYIYMTKDERACFWEADLFSTTPTIDVVDWWDKLSIDIRSNEDTHKIIIGRLGERLTLEYEKRRTGYDPLWISFDSNLTGFDIISRESATEDRQLLIEVKASSEEYEFAEFYISKNEWNVALYSAKYKFYIWHICDMKKLAMLSVKLLKEYIPINQKSGQWESVKIPFSAFDDFFIRINF